MPKYLLLQRRARAPARARRDLPAAATAYAEAARRGTNVAERDHLVRRAARARAGRAVGRSSHYASSARTAAPEDHHRSSTDSKERKVMDPQEITEQPQDRTGAWVRRHDEYTPQQLAGGRS